MATTLSRRLLRDRVAHELVGLCHAGLDAPTLARALLARLAPVIPVDAAWAATADPETLLFAHAASAEIPAHATPRFLANEFLHDDVNKFAALAQSAAPVRSLFDATRRAPERSGRFRDILAPLHLGDELRAALRVDGTCWGYLCLHRALGATPFSPDDAAFLAAVAPHAAAGLRQATMSPVTASACDEEAAGVVLLSERLEVLGITPAARRWLAELAERAERAERAEPGAGGELPASVLAVATRLRAIEHARRSGDAAPATAPAMPRVRVRHRSGRWLVVEATRAAAPGAPDDATSDGAPDGPAAPIVVTLRPASPALVLPVLLHAFALTAREAEVARQVARGASTAAIAEALRISPHTVQQHLKAIFAKAGVGSRRELVAAVHERGVLSHRAERRDARRPR